MGREGAIFFAGEPTWRSQRHVAPTGWDFIFIFSLRVVEDVDPYDGFPRFLVGTGVLDGPFRRSSDRIASYRRAGVYLPPQRYPITDNTAAASHRPTNL